MKMFLQISIRYLKRRRRSIFLEKNATKRGERCENENQTLDNSWTVSSLRDTIVTNVNHVFATRDRDDADGVCIELKKREEASLLNSEKAERENRCTFRVRWRAVDRKCICSVFKIISRGFCFPLSTISPRRARVTSPSCVNKQSRA